MRKQPEATNATQKNLIDAFCLLSRKKPIEKISVKEITHRAGYNRCTFYQYFKDVYDLRDNIENITLSQIKENFTKNISKDNFNKSFFDAFININQERAAYFELLLNAANRAHFTDKLMTDVLPVFMKRFQISEENPHAEYLAGMYFAMVVATISHWIESGRTMPLAELTELLGRALTDGVITEIGRS